MLRSQLDSTQRTIGQASPRNSHIESDSLSVLQSIADSLQHKISLIASQLADSLNVIKSVAAQDLGDVFYTEVVVPDSAFYWYEKSLALDYSPIRSPRILYILAELSRMNTGEKNHTPEEYYTRLDRNFPESIYAEEARRFLRKEITVKKTDSAAVYYGQAEKQIDAKQYTNAIKTFRSIAQSYPKSPLAAKSEYAVAWIFENNLGQPESTLVQYKHVMKNYDGTKYAIAAANRSARIVQSDNVKRDTVKAKDVKTDTSRIRRAAIDSTKVNTVKIDTSKIIRIDTSKSHSMKIDTSEMKITKKDTSELNSRPLNQKVPIPGGVGKDSVALAKKIIK
jgi:tetratricopeptide (TPR) repeat protein